jgi:hypothetical protein
MEVKGHLVRRNGETMYQMVISNQTQEPLSHFAIQCNENMFSLTTETMPDITGAFPPLLFDNCVCILLSSLHPHLSVEPGESVHPLFPHLPFFTLPPPPASPPSLPSLPHRPQVARRRSENGCEELYTTSRCGNGAHVLCRLLFAPGRGCLSLSGRPRRARGAGFGNDYRLIAVFDRFVTVGSA